MSEPLALEGFEFVVPVVAAADGFDAQGHLNNAAIVKIFNDLRVAYVMQEVGEAWREHLRREGLVVAARELHVRYDSEGFPGESFAGAMRYVRREGKAALLEQRLVETATSRSIARAWVVQLLVRDGTVVDWPDLYFDRIAEIEGRVIECRPRADRPWGPGE